MSYSRWGGSDWYTYWQVQDKATEDRDTAIFTICAVTSFTAKELRDDMDACMEKVAAEDTAGDIDELRGYAREFLADIDSEYPEPNVR